MKGKLKAMSLCGIENIESQWKNLRRGVEFILGMPMEVVVKHTRLMAFYHQSLHQVGDTVNRYCWRGFPEYSGARTAAEALSWLSWLRK